MILYKVRLECKISSPSAVSSGKLETPLYIFLIVGVERGEVYGCNIAHNNIALNELERKKNLRSDLSRSRETNTRMSDDGRTGCTTFAFFLSSLTIHEKW